MTTVFVQNPHATSITLNVTYYFSDDAASIAGTALACDQLGVAGDAAITFDPVRLQCHLDAILSRPAQRLRNDGPRRRNGDLQDEYVLRLFTRVAKPSGTTGAGNGFSSKGSRSATSPARPIRVIGLASHADGAHLPVELFRRCTGRAGRLPDHPAQGETGALLGNLSAVGASMTLAPYHTTRISQCVNAAAFQAQLPWTSRTFAPRSSIATTRQ